MLGQYKRAERVGELIHHELCRILLRQVSDPRLKKVTVTRIKLSNDLRCAKIYVSVMEDEEQVSQTMQGLNKAKRFIRRALGRHLELRYTPELIFRRDDSIAYGMHIDQVLQELKAKGELGEDNTEPNLEGSDFGQ
jgi:ribosome-binding factor A